MTEAQLDSKIAETMATLRSDDHWTGNSGPSSAISLDPTINYKDIEREIGNDLFDALDVAD